MALARRHRAAALAAALLWAAPDAPRAAVTAQVQPGFSTSTGTSRENETGLETRFDATDWVQRYRLTVDQRLYPTLTLTGGGNLVWNTGTSSPRGAPSTDVERRQWNAYGRLAAGGPDLNGGLDYNRSWEDGELRTGGVTVETPGIVRESFAAAGLWRPADLPTLSLRLSRSNSYDAAREYTDVTNDEALLSVRHEPVPDLLLSYSLRYGRSTDHRTDLVRSEISNGAEAAWTSRYLGDRGNVYLSYRIAARAFDTSAALPGAEVAEQQPVDQGLSKVEDAARGDTPTHIELNVNGALVDGNLTASAGVNLGSAARTLIPRARHLGARFFDVITPVNEIHVHVDRTLTPAVAGGFSWDVYESADNLNWTVVAENAAATFNPVLLRFELEIPERRARYLKVVTVPIEPTQLTNDPFAEIFVTELRFLEVIDAALVRGGDSDVAGSLSGTTRVLLVRDLGLAYDFSGFLSHAEGRALTWSVVNGLSFNRRLDPVFAVAGRVDRADADAGTGWQAQNRWSASLSVDPLPTAGALVSYTGQLAQLPEGTAVSNSGTLSVRTDLYEGLALGGLASLSWGRTELDVTSRATLVSASVSVVPNRVVSLAGSVSYGDNRQSGGGQPERTDQQGSVEGSASITPFPALALSGSVVRQFGGTAGSATLASFSGAFSPFRGGDLQLRYTYQETLDVEADRRTRVHGPGARWNIRPGWHADVAWTAQDNRSPATTDRTRSLNANLLITFR